LDYEIFVVDDGGHENLGSLLYGLPVTILETGESGSAAAARNLGARGFLGDILVFVDADVIIASDALPNLLAPIADGRTEAAIGNYTEDITGLSFGTSYKQLYVACIRRRRAGYVVNDFWTAIGAVSRPVFDILGGFDARFSGANGEDADLGIRMTRDGHRILAVPEAVGQHRHGQTIGGIVANDWKKGALALRQYQAGHRKMSDNLHATKRDVAAVLAAGATLAAAAFGIGLDAPVALAGSLVLLALYAGARGDLLDCFRRQGAWFAVRSFVLMFGLDLLRAACAARMVLARGLSYGPSRVAAARRPDTAVAASVVRQDAGPASTKTVKQA
jgi:glycosyltransferase involved in cell wall biosynthesis